MLTSSALLILATSHLAWAAPHCLLVDRSVDPSASRPGASGSASAAGNKSNGTFIGAAWYAGWHSSDFTLSNVSWSKYSSVIYSFAVTTSDTNFISLESSDQELLPQFVETAHQNDVNAILSIGGWTGSQFFSSSVATAENRTAFAQAVMATVKQYSLDGVEFDWEYPGKQGLGCNVVSSNDSANFLAFLQELRAQDGAAAGRLLVSAAVAVTPFAGPDGEPMSDVSAFAAVLDTIEVMNYDVWGSWSPTVGPNAPLNDTCAPFADGSAVSAVKAWTDAGFAASQIILGVASYGHSFHVDKSAALASPVSGTNSTLTLFSPFDASLQPAGDKWDQTAGGVDECGNPNVVGGVFDFWGLIDGGFLNTDGTVSEGIDYTFDNCSQTPFAYNATSEVMVSFDNADSFFEKGQFIADMGLAGFAMWEAGGDSNDILLDAIEQGMGVDIELCGN